MKKLLSAILSFVMVFILVAPMSAYATENNDSEREEILALARQVFPEYITSPKSESFKPTITTQSVDENDKVVRNVTRKVSDTLELTYVEMKSGHSFVIENNIEDVISGSKESGTSSNVTGGKQYTVTIKIASVQSDYAGVFTMSNVKYTIYDNAYDKINSKGTAKANSSQYCTYTANGSDKLTEDSISSAVFGYALTFKLGNGNNKYNYYFTVDFKVGADEAVVDIYI